MPGVPVWVKLERIGNQLNMYYATESEVASEGSTLQPGCLYIYDIAFGPWAGQ
jgi:hypothetical protein